MVDKVIIRYGDSTLKGRNRHRFIERLNALIEEKVDNDALTYEHKPGSLLIDLHDQAPEPVIEALHRVSGLRGFSLAKSSSRAIDDVVDAALELLDDTVETFKVETRRADKGHPLTSPEISSRVGGGILKKRPDLRVDVHVPDATVHVDMHTKEALVYLDKLEGLGGYPVGIAGKGLLMLSGGIDSPVAGFLSMKQGIAIEAIHFESSPMTSVESAQKVFDLVARLSVYAEGNRITVHFVPFMEVHKDILEKTPQPYHIILMRRMMMRIASLKARSSGIPVLITGESVGQVASQTLDSISVIESESDRPVLRPLVTAEKLDIITLAERIGTFEVSIRPFEDCCSVYVPKSPTVSPRQTYARRYEKLLDVAALVRQAHEGTRSLVVHKGDCIDLGAHGLTTREALAALKGEET